MSAPSETTAPRRQIFRQEALDRLRTPDQVDELMHVVGPVGWVGLLALAFVLACAVYWSVFSTIPTYVAGQGLLGSAVGARRNVVASEAGILREVYVKVGEKVKVGQHLARIEIRQATEMRDDARRTLQLLNEERDHQAAFWDAFLRDQSSDFEATKANLETQIKWAEEEIAGRQRILDASSGLGAKGLATSVQIESARDSLIGAMADLDQARLRLQQLGSKQINLQNQRMTALNALDDRILTAKEQLSDAERQRREGGQVRANIDGVVVERDGQLDSTVEPGSPILVVQAVRSDIEGIFFANPQQGKNIRRGMTAYISPSTAEPERYGSIRAEVAWVSPEPQSNDAVTREVGDPGLAHLLTGGVPPIAFGVKMQHDPGTPSGLAWTSGKGPDHRIQDGTLASANVAVKQEAPIDLVIPALRRLTGINP